MPKLFRKAKGGGPKIITNAPILASVRTISDVNYRIILAFIHVVNLGLSLAVISIFGRYFAQSAWLGIPSFFVLVYTVSPLNVIFSVHALVWICAAVGSATHKAVSLALGLVALTMTSVHFGLSFYFNDHWREWLTELNDTFSILNARLEFSEDNVYRLVSLVVVQWIASLLSLAAVGYLRCEAQDEKRATGPTGREALADALAADLRGIVEDRFRAAMAGVERLEQAMNERAAAGAAGADVRELAEKMAALQREIRAGRDSKRASDAGDGGPPEASPNGRRAESDGADSAGSGGRRRRRRRGKKKGRGRRSDGELEEGDAPRRQWREDGGGDSYARPPPALYSYGAAPPAAAIRPGFYYYPAPAAVLATAALAAPPSMGTAFDGGSPLSPRKPDALPSPRAMARYGSPEGRPPSRPSQPPPPPPAPASAPARPPTPPPRAPTPPPGGSSGSLAPPEGAGVGASPRSRVEPSPRSRVEPSPRRVEASPRRSASGAQLPPLAPGTPGRGRPGAVRRANTVAVPGDVLLRPAAHYHDYNEYVHTRLEATANEGARLVDRLLSDAGPAPAPERADRASPDRPAPAALPSSPRVQPPTPTPEPIPEADEEGYDGHGRPSGDDGPPAEPPAPASPPHAPWPPSTPATPPPLASSPLHASPNITQRSLAPSSPLLSAPSSARSLQAAGQPPPPRPGEEATRRVQDVYRRLGTAKLGTATALGPKYAAKGTKFRVQGGEGPPASHPPRFR